MLLYKFTRGADLALTRDESGSNLPGGGDGWILVKAVSAHTAEDARRVGLSYRDVTKGVADQGYYMWQAAPGT